MCNSNGREPEVKDSRFFAHAYKGGIRLLIPIAVLLGFVVTAYIVQTATEVTGEGVQNSIYALDRHTTVDELEQAGYRTVKPDNASVISAFFDDVKSSRQSVLRLIESDDGQPIVRVFMFDPYEQGLDIDDHGVRFSDPGQIREWRYDISNRRWLECDARYSRNFDTARDDGTVTVTLTSIPVSIYAPHYMHGTSWDMPNGTLRYPEA